MGAGQKVRGRVGRQLLVTMCPERSHARKETSEDQCRKEDMLHRTG